MSDHDIDEESALSGQARTSGKDVSGKDADVPRPNTFFGGGQQTLGVGSIIDAAGAAIDPSTETFYIHSEAWRILGYIGFWIMVIFAIIMSQTFVGQDKLDNSPLVATFGFNNICINWDYSPAKELTAMVYPFLMEYPFQLYVIHAWLQVRRDRNDGKVSRALYIASSVMLPFKVMFIAWFRMIFVVDAVNPGDSIMGHYAGFLGLQVGLVMIAVTNVWYTKEIGLTWPFMGERGSVIMVSIYVALLGLLTGFKMWWALTTILSHDVFDTEAGYNLIKFIDRFWMVLAAVLPVVGAEVMRRDKNSRPMKITIT